MTTLLMLFACLRDLTTDSAAKADCQACIYQKGSQYKNNSSLTIPSLILRKFAPEPLAQRRLVAPGYTYLQDMVGRTVSGERLRITRLLGHALTRRSSGN